MVKRRVSQRPREEGPGTRKSQCKGPEMEASLSGSRDQKQVWVAGWPMGGRVW